LVSGWAKRDCLLDHVENGKYLKNGWMSRRKIDGGYACVGGGFGEGENKGEDE